MAEPNLIGLTAEDGLIQGFLKKEGDGPRDGVAGAGFTGTAEGGMAKKAALKFRSGNGLGCEIPRNNL